MVGLGWDVGQETRDRYEDGKIPSRGMATRVMMVEVMAVSSVGGSILMDVWDSVGS
jgi:hypothetical protein